MEKGADKEEWMKSELICQALKFMYSIFNMPKPDIYFFSKPRRGRANEMA